MGVKVIYVHDSSKCNDLGARNLKRKSALCLISASADRGLLVSVTFAGYLPPITFQHIMLRYMGETPIG